MSSEAVAEAEQVLAGQPVSLAPGVQGVLLAELTDEELAVLDGLTVDERLVVLPWLDGLTPEQRDVAMLTAFRSMVARGLATGPDQEALDAALQDVDADGRSSVQIAVEETVAVLLRSRAAAHRVVSCQRNVRGTPDYLYLFEVEDEGDQLLLGELVVGTGLHRYFRVDDRDTARVLEGYLVPEPWGERSAAALVVAAEDAAAGRTPLSAVAQLDQAALRAEVIVIDLQAPRIPLLHAVFAGPQEVRTMSSRAGSTEPLVFDTRTADELGRWVRDEVLARP